MRYLKCLLFSFFLGLVGMQCSCTVSALSMKTTQPQITFDSFTGVYHLSRDSRGLSQLTTEETILADFPGEGSFYGITRSIPKNFQNHSVNIKILGVSDAAGNIVPYKTATDGSNNLVITTGDPSITLYGSQTIKIRYRTTGVINLKKGSDELLLNVNGRGWDHPFNKVDASLHIPVSFGASLKSDPACYTGLNSASFNNCKINTIKSTQESVTTASATNIKPHQALIVKIEFNTSTFTNKHGISSEKLALISLVLIASGVICWLTFARSKS
jgi:hypothetical protein